jgi:D-tyrosyl-tRNA(Tyr) deacylase
MSLSIIELPFGSGEDCLVRGLVQRVTTAAVVARGANGSFEAVGEIGAGLCVLIGVTHDDTEATARRLANKVWGLRVLDDANGVMNRSLSDLAEDGHAAEVLAVSQFTLYGDTTGGRRPSWIAAARPEHAEPLVGVVVDELRRLGCTVATGRFRTEMRVSLVNDGPVTVMLEV